MLRMIVTALDDKARPAPVSMGAICAALSEAGFLHVSVQGAPAEDRERLLREERDQVTAYALKVEADARRLRVDAVNLRRWLLRIVEWHGPEVTEHVTGCLMDDTCECPEQAALEAILQETTHLGETDG